MAQHSVPRGRGNSVSLSLHASPLPQQPLGTALGLAPFPALPARLLPVPPISLLLSLELEARLHTVQPAQPLGTASCELKLTGNCRQGALEALASISALTILISKSGSCCLPSS